MSDTPAKPRIAIGPDHAGFSVKETIRKYLESADYAVSDLGTSSEDSVDYPDYGKAVGECVISKQADMGIAVCGSGIGISIAANKVPGIRAALAHDVNTARLAREHNDANVLALGGRIVTGETAIEMVQVFLTTAYLGGRHQRRLDKITAIENAATSGKSKARNLKHSVGCFTSSKWRPAPSRGRRPPLPPIDLCFHRALGDLFVSQGNHGINPRRATGRNAARKQCAP